MTEGSLTTRPTLWLQGGDGDGAWTGGGGRAWGSFQKVSVPKLKYQEKPDIPAVISPTAQVLLQQVTHGTFLEIASLERTRFEQDIKQVFFQLTS